MPGMGAAAAMSTTRRGDDRVTSVVQACLNGHGYSSAVAAWVKASLAGSGALAMR